MRFKSGIINVLKIHWRKDYRNKKGEISHPRRPLSRFFLSFSSHRSHSGTDFFRRPSHRYLQAPAAELLLPLHASPSLCSSRPAPALVPARPTAPARPCRARPISLRIPCKLLARAAFLCLAMAVRRCSSLPCPSSLSPSRLPFPASSFPRAPSLCSSFLPLRAPCLPRWPFGCSALPSPWRSVVPPLSICNSSSRHSSPWCFPEPRPLARLPPARRRLDRVLDLAPCARLTACSSSPVRFSSALPRSVVSFPSRA
jgi:hypothetical protein